MRQILFCMSRVAHYMNQTEFCLLMISYMLANFNIFQWHGCTLHWKLNAKICHPNEIIE